MRLEQFEYLQAVDSCGSISAAARKLHITHQGLSIALRALEKELGVDLFERNFNGVSLNDDGRFVLNAAVEFTDKLKQVQNHYVNLCGSLHICSIFAVIDVFISGILANYYHEYPDVEINIDMMYTQDVFDKMNAKEADIGFVILTAGQLTEFKERYPLLAMQILTYMDTFVEVSKYSELAKYKSVSVKNLQKYKMAINAARSLLKDEYQVKFYNDLKAQEIIFEPVRGIYENRICHENIFGISFMTQNKVLQLNSEFVRLPLKENIRRYVIALWENDLKMSAEMRVLLDKINSAYPLEDGLV